MKTILVINGPNMNALGKRNTELYGEQTLEQLEDDISKAAEKLKLKCVFMQTNHEGEIIDALHKAEGKFDGIILNAAGYSHTSVAIRDAVEAACLPVVEVHMTNIYAREDFRRTSLISAVCTGVIGGFGAKSYILALHSFK